MSANRSGPDPLDPPQPQLLDQAHLSGLRGYGPRADRCNEARDGYQRFVSGSLHETVAV